MDPTPRSAMEQWARADRGLPAVEALCSAQEQLDQRAPTPDDQLFAAMDASVFNGIPSPMVQTRPTQRCLPRTSRALAVAAAPAIPRLPKPPAA